MSSSQWISLICNVNEPETILNFVLVCQEAQPNIQLKVEDAMVYQPGRLARL